MEKQKKNATNISIPGVSTTPRHPTDTTGTGPRRLLRHQLSTLAHVPWSCMMKLGKKKCIKVWGEKSFSYRWWWCSFNWIPFCDFCSRTMMKNWGNWSKLTCLCVQMGEDFPHNFEGTAGIKGSVRTCFWPAGHMFFFGQNVKKQIPTLKLTAKAPIQDGWLEYYSSFLLGPGLLWECIPCPFWETGIFQAFLEKRLRFRNISYYASRLHTMSCAELLPRICHQSRRENPELLGEIGGSNTNTPLLDKVLAVFLVRVPTLEISSIYVYTYLYLYVYHIKWWLPDLEISNSTYAKKLSKPLKLKRSLRSRGVNDLVYGPKVVPMRSTCCDVDALMAKRSKFDSKIDQVCKCGYNSTCGVPIYKAISMCKRGPSCGNKSFEISQAHLLLEVVQSRRICQV